MSEADSFFKKFKDGFKGELYTCAIAQIEVYDPKLSKADVKLLPDGDLIKSVPVGMPLTKDFIIRMPFEKGDHVLVVFAQREIDAIMYGATKPSKRMLAIDDAIVICGINLFTSNLPTEHGDDMVIAKKDFSSKIVLDKGGNITVESAGNVYLGGADASEGVPLGNTLKQWLDNHTHDYTWTDGGGSGTTAKPSSSPSPSGKVKTK